MLGTNDQDTDMDITVILPQMRTFGTEECEPVEEGVAISTLSHDAIFSEFCPKSLFRTLKAKLMEGKGSVYQVGLQSPLIRLFMLTIQGIFYCINERLLQNKYSIFLSV
jgi:hypothetical protein